MTQPPDDRPRPDQPPSDNAPENEPTVAWTPPEPEPAPSPDQGGVGYAAIPEEGAPAPAAPPPAPPAPNMPTEPPVEPPATPADSTPPPASPIISAAPTEPTSGWQTPDQPAPGQPAPPPTTAPGSGWEVPAAATAVATSQDGYVISGIGSRIVAWLIDTTLAGIIPAAIGLAVIDFPRIVRQALDEAERNPAGRFDPTPYTIPVTLDFVLITLIGLGIQYLYFVGFWTSRWRATPGMIGLKMRVVDATSGSALSIVDATKRWIALGFPLTLLGLVAALQGTASVLQFGLLIFLFFTTVTHARRQGLHDRWANSLVIRSVTSGDGATFAGCLVWGLLLILLFFVFTTFVLASVLPTIQDYVNSLPSPTT
jgi:uncharacterized RDD family membrane protein YckC